VNQPLPMRMLAPAPGPGFEQPFEMLEACHERVHRMLALLGRLRAHVAAHGPDEPARQAARDVMRYFDVAAPEHHRDEELHVFPVLVAHGDASTLAVVARLMRDHSQMESSWAGARAVLAAVESGELDALSPAHEAALEAFAGPYPAHIEAEERIAYPAAVAAMDAPRLQAMGLDMMARRGAS
jgi:hemerythrin-like domain-containing protein